MNRFQRISSALAALLVFGPTIVALPVTASAQVATAQISGTVVTQDNSLPIGGASISLYRGETLVTQTTTNADGQYSFSSVTAGEYSIVIRATGYTPTRIDTVTVLDGSTTTVRTPIRRAGSSSSNGIREIGSTSATARNTLASTATIQYNIDPEQIQQQGFLKAADAIGQIPGLNIQGGPHTVGDDTSIDIRGMGEGEVRPLIDGHSIGPIGVLSPDYYNYANSGYNLLDNISVTLGSGATGLYGVDVIGGTIDFQTLTPTLKPHAELLQEFGNDGTAGTVFKATGTLGRLGYAIGHGVTGTYGVFAPGPVFQGNRPNNNQNENNGGACLPQTLTVGGNSVTVPDISQCNTNLNTYSVSGNYKELNDLVKLRYNFTPTTALTVDGYSGNHHSDSTGNGDNDNVPYALQLAQVQAAPQTCSGGYLAITQESPLKTSCLTAQQLAQASSGPSGGGQDRNRGTTLQDFTGRLTSQIGLNSISVSAFSDYYNFHKYSQTAGGLDPTGTFFIGGGTYTDDYLTHGILATDDITTANNDVGLGYYVEHQKSYGDSLSFSGTTGLPYFAEDPILGSGDYSFFVRENYTPAGKFAVYANVWDRRSSVTNITTLDPRLSLVYKPTRKDVVRITGGQADGDPSISVATQTLSGVTNPSSLNPTCNLSQLNSIGTGGNTALKPERSSDLEGAYGHRFWNDSTINVVGYVSSVKDQLFSGAFAIPAYALASPQIAPFLSQFASRLTSACPGQSYDATTVISRLGLNGVFNASSALFRGLEFTGRIRVVPALAIDYTYNIQSAQQFGEPLYLLQGNPFLLDGGQIVGIPVHKGSVSADYTHRGYEAQLQLYYVGDNNTLNRPAYTFYNGFISKAIAHNVSATLSVYNLFNQNAQQYGYFGEQLPNTENQYQPQYTNAITQYQTAGGGTTNELLGLQPRLFTFQLSLRM